MWKDWIESRFYSYLVQYINTLEEDRIYLLSPFARLYETYIRLNINRKIISFIGWIRSLKRSDYSEDFITIEYNENVTTDLIMKCIYGGIVLIQDVATIEELCNFFPNAWNNATIKGVRFLGRGTKCAEIFPARRVKKWGGITELILPSNPLNNLLVNWHESEQYSSIFKFKHWNINTTTKRNSFTTQYGQANFFFRMVLPSDPYLNNVGFVNLTGRIHNNYTVGACSVPFIKVKITTVDEIPEPSAPLPPVDSAEINTKNILSKTRTTRSETDVPKDSKSQNITKSHSDIVVFERIVWR
jgi:hypothetical protein